MPKQIIAAMKKGYQGKGLSEEEINHRVYGKLNEQGFMHGNKETSAGVAAEDKYTRDHSIKRKKKMKGMGF